MNLHNIGRSFADPHALWRCRLLKGCAGLQAHSKCRNTCQKCLQGLYSKRNMLLKMKCQSVPERKAGTVQARSVVVPACTAIQWPKGWQAKPLLAPLLLSRHNS